MFIIGLCISLPCSDKGRDVQIKDSSSFKRKLHAKGTAVTGTNELHPVQRESFLSEELIASISGSIMGDEHTDSYYLCPVCQVYTVASWWDDFTGVETIESVRPHLRAAR